MIATLFFVRNLDDLAHYKYTLGVIGVALLLLPMLIGTEIYGSKLWIIIGPFSFQPGELAKILIVPLPRVLPRKQPRGHSRLRPSASGPLVLSRFRMLLPLFIMWGHQPAARGLRTRPGQRPALLRLLRDHAFRGNWPRELRDHLAWTARCGLCVLLSLLRPRAGRAWTSGSTRGKTPRGADIRSFSRSTRSPTEDSPARESARGCRRSSPSSSRTSSSRPSPRR